MKLARIKTEYCDCKEEEQVVYKIIEDNGDRCIIEPVKCELPIVPTELVSTDMLEIIGDTMKVKLESKENPDLKTYDRHNPNIKAVWIDCTSLADASIICRSFIVKHDLGSGNWTGGQVKNAANKTVGRISYNGRIWNES